MERTLAIIKPDAVSKKAEGKIIDKILESGFSIKAMRRELLTVEQARGFYAVHKERSFFNDLVRFMTSGPVVLIVLEQDGAIKKWRDLMGPTDSTKAPANTIRGTFGTNIEKNACHGSDALETAAFEIGWFFRGFETQF